MGDATSLGIFMRQCRTGLKYTSRQVARLSTGRSDIPSISNSYLISVENGKHIPRLDKIIALADLLNVPVTHFVDRCREDIGGPMPVPDARIDDLMAAAIERVEMNDYGKALELFRQTQAAAKQANGSLPPVHMYEIRLQIANCYRSLKISRVAKDEIEAILRDRSLDARSRARASFVLAEIYRDESNHFLGRLVAREAMQLARDAGDEVLEAKLLSVLGNFEMENGQHDEALALYREAAAKADKLGRGRVALLARIRQGYLLVTKRDYHRAIDLLRGELVDCEENDPYVRGSLHMGLAKAYFGAENYRATGSHARSARDCADRLDDPSLLFLSTFYLWQVARRQRADEVARGHFERLRYYRNKLDVDFEEIQRFDRHEKQIRSRANSEEGATP